MSASPSTLLHRTLISLRNPIRRNAASRRQCRTANTMSRRLATMPPSKPRHPPSSHRTTTLSNHSLSSRAFTVITIRIAKPLNPLGNLHCETFLYAASNAVEHPNDEAHRDFLLLTCKTKPGTRSSPKNPKSNPKQKPNACLKLAQPHSASPPPFVTPSNLQADPKSEPPTCYYREEILARFSFATSPRGCQGLCRRGDSGHGIRPHAL
ncbi:hypothetical protein LR48_Vigan07g154300 [Vigna angularis]|uniref:Uncharacterized protein n=1 Tax=Phaseolus angularis TaxID=3914 RepID=A0A0L9UZ58_PHAAN|nr:hypothetical protein LR48_Vigan07g154300 [Vigna angularis]